MMPPNRPNCMFYSRTIVSACRVILQFQHNISPFFHSGDFKFRGGSPIAGGQADGYG